MASKYSGRITKIFNYGFTVKTVTGESGTLKKESILDTALAESLGIDSKIVVYDNGRRSVKGGILWDLSPVKSTSETSQNVDNNIDLPRDNPLSSIFRGKSREDAMNLFVMLVSSFTGADDEHSYAFSLNLIAINRSYKPILDASLNNSLFLKASREFKLKMWLDKLVRYCYIGDVFDKYSERDSCIIEYLDNEYRFKERFIENNIILPKCYTTGIQDLLINRIENAQNNIKVAVAWFTNPKLLNALVKAAKRGVKIILVTNNDLINNGGYCLRLDDIIDAGGSIHLAEYPEFVNHKFCIVDNSTVVTGSYNWTIYAEHINHENVLLIEGEFMKDIIVSYVNIFNDLCDQYDLIDKMPDSIPERPQYDRSSFKQYVTEEVLFLARKTRSQEKRDFYYQKALRLSPNHPQIPAHYRTAEHIQTLQRRDAISTQSQSLETQKLQALSNIDLHKSQLQEVEARRNNIVQSGRATVQAEHLQSIESEIQSHRQQIESAESEVTSIEAQQSLISSISDNKLQGQSGKFNVRLEWKTSDDLDLHLKVPDGQEIYYSNKSIVCKGCHGHLDVDANAGTPTSESPQENIFWDEDAPEGDYQVDINLYTHRSGKNEIPFIVTLFPENKEAMTRTSSFKNIPSDGKPTITIFKFRYSKAEGIQIY